MRFDLQFTLYTVCCLTFQLHSQNYFFLTLSRSVESNNFLDKDLPTHYHHAHFAFETKFTRYRLCKPSVEGNSLLGTCAVLLLCCVPPYGSSQNPLLFTSWNIFQPTPFISLSGRPFLNDLLLSGL